MLNRNYIEPYKDMFNIYNLITKINKYYRLFFDKKNNKFLIININNNYEVCYTFNNFNENILLNLQKSQVINSNKIFEEIEICNNKLIENYVKNNSYLTNCKMEELKKYSCRTNKILLSDINKINEVKNA